QFVRADILARKYLDRPELAKEFYEILGLEWESPESFQWLEKYVDTWETTRKRGWLRSKYYTFREWFEELGLEMYSDQDIEADEVVFTRKSFERAGIFERLDIKIKNALSIEDMIETAYRNWDTLDSWEKTEIRIKVNSADGYDHPYAQLIRERLKQEKADSN
ncbi:unnamed protein product, partial [marine sediment metagenome]